MLCFYMTGSVMNERTIKAKMQKSIHLTSSREPSGMEPATELGSEQLYLNISSAKSVLSFQRRSQSSCEKCSPARPDRGGSMTTVGTQAATCGGRGFPPDPTLAEFLSTRSLKLAAGNYLWKEYGRVLQAYQIGTMLSNPSQQWECTDWEKTQLRVVLSSLRFTSQSDCYETS